MSYKTYTTEAIVCGSRQNNTSDKAFLLFTREAGMLWATARSVREERSRQRYALQDFSEIKVSLVRGKSGWRIGSAENTLNYFSQSGEQLARVGVTSIVRTLRQFLHGEVAQPALFDDARLALNLAAKISCPPVSGGESTSPETLIVDIFSLRLLHRLGYVAPSSAINGYLNEAKWWTLPPLPPAAISAIENAKAVSHL